MNNCKILITGGNKARRLELAEIIYLGCEQQHTRAEVIDLGKFDAITHIDIPKTTRAAIFVAHHEGKKFAGIYERLIKGSQDKLLFVHVDLK